MLHMNNRLIVSNTHELSIFQKHRTIGIQSIQGELDIRYESPAESSKSICLATIEYDL